MWNLAYTFSMFYSNYEGQSPQIIWLNLGKYIGLFVDPSYFSERVQLKPSLRDLNSFLYFSSTSRILNCSFDLFSSLLPHILALFKNIFSFFPFSSKLWHRASKRMRGKIPPKYYICTCAPFGLRILVTIVELSTSWNVSQDWKKCPCIWEDMIKLWDNCKSYSLIWNQLACWKRYRLRAFLI